MRAKNFSSRLLGLIAFVAVAVASCSDPFSMKRAYLAASSSVAAGDARLVIQTRQGAEQSGRAALDDATYLTLRLQSTSGGLSIEKFASASREVDGSYIVAIPGMVAGMWKVSARFYADSTASTMLAYANKAVYIAVGSATSVDLNVYLPGSVSSGNLSIAKTVSSVEIDAGSTLWGSSTSNPNPGPSLPQGRVVQLRASTWSAELDGDGLPIAATDQRVSWTSSDENVAELTSNGTLRARSVGTAYITATSAEGMVQAVVTIQIEDAVVGHWSSTNGVVDEAFKINQSAGQFYFVHSVFDHAAQYLQYRRGTVTPLGSGQYQFQASEYLNLTTMTWMGTESSSTFVVAIQNLDTATRWAMEEYPTTFTRDAAYVPVTSLALDSGYTDTVDIDAPVPTLKTLTNIGATFPGVYWSTPDAAVISLTVDPQGRPGGSFVFNGSVTYPATVKLIARSVDDPTVILEVPFTVNRPTYTLAFDANGATGGSVPPSTGYAKYSTITLPAVGDNGLDRVGFLLTGWSTGSDGSGDVYQPGATLSLVGDRYLYAQWAALYSVSYDANGADSGTAPTGQTAIAGTSISVAANTGALAKTGYNLVGWNTASDGSGTFYPLGPESAFSMPASSVVLYATWGTNLLSESWESGASGWSMELDSYSGTSWTLSGPARTGTHGARNSWADSEASYTISDVSTLGLATTFLSAATQSLDLSFYVGNDGSATYWARMYLYDSSSAQVGYVDIPGSIISGPDGWKRVDLRIPGNSAYTDVSSITVVLGGHDGIGWYGYYGSWIDDVSLDLIPTPSN